MFVRTHFKKLTPLSLVLLQIWHIFCARTLFLKYIEARGEINRNAVFYD